MRSHARIVGACCVALFIPLCVPLFTGRVFVWDDLAAFHLPLRFLYREALRSGDSILWSPALYSGTYLFGEGQAGMAHPVHWLLYRSLPLGVAFNAELVGSYFVALAGMWLLLRRYTSNEAALFGAMVFAFSGFNLLHLSQTNAVAIGAHLPWVLMATHVLLTSGARSARAAAFAGVALLVGSQLLLGYPQYVWLTFLADGSFALCLVWAGAPISRTVLLASAVVLGAFIGSVQLLPTLDALSHSVRAVTTPEFRLSYSLSPINLTQMWSPYALAVGQDSGLYDGAFCTAALAWLAARWPDLRRRALLLTLLAFAALMVLLALGRDGGLYPWLARLPGLSSFRAPSRYILLAHLAFAGIAAFVFEDLARLARTGDRMALDRCWPLAVPVLLSLVTSIVAARLVGSAWAGRHDLAFSNAARTGLGLGLVTVTSLLILLVARGVHAALPLLVVLVAFDMALWGYRYAWRIVPPQTIEEVASTVRLPDAARPGERLLPPAGQSQRNIPVLSGFRLSAGYLGLNPRTTLDVEDPLAQRLAGVSWRSSGGDWVRVPDAMPRARLLSDVRSSERIDEDIRKVDVTRVALVDRTIDGLSGTAGLARVIVDRPGRIVVQTIAPARQLLVLTERFHEGWRASDEEGDCPTARVFGDYVGCVVNGGTHEETFVFAPASARVGLWLTFVGLALTIVSTWCIWDRR